MRLPCCPGLQIVCQGPPSSATWSAILLLVSFTLQLWLVAVLAADPEPPRDVFLAEASAEEVQTRIPSCPNTSRSPGSLRPPTQWQQHEEKRLQWQQGRQQCPWLLQPQKQDGWQQRQQQQQQQQLQHQPDDKWCSHNGGASFRSARRQSFGDALHRGSAKQTGVEGSNADAVTGWDVAPANAAQSGAGRQAAAGNGGMAGDDDRQKNEERLGNGNKGMTMRFAKSVSVGSSDGAIGDGGCEGRRQSFDGEGTGEMTGDGAASMDGSAKRRSGRIQRDGALPPRGGKDARLRVVKPPRVVAVGDLHGDLENALETFHLARVVNASGSWTGQDAILVQTGDVVDRGPASIALLHHLWRLRKEAAAAGGELIMLMGNHELMNLQGNFLYVDPLELNKVGANRWRSLFSATGEWGQELLRLPAAAVVGEGHCRTLLVHAGLLPSLAGLTVKGLNHAVSSAIFQGAATGTYLSPLLSDMGPLWYRGYAIGAEREVCPLVFQTLWLVNATRMLVGHTPQAGGITVRCAGALTIIDVGISKAYLNQPAAWECLDGAATALYPSRSERLPRPQVPEHKSQPITN